MQKEYYINHIVLNGHLNNPVYKPITSNTGQKNFQNLYKLVDKYSSNFAKKGKKYVLNNALKTSEFYCTINAHKRKSFKKQYYKMTQLKMTQSQMNQKVEQLLLAQIVKHKP